MERTRQAGHRAFTLIELLVVVAIIALLIAILIPSLGRAKELSNRSACGANLTGIVKAMNLYSSENSDQYPVTQPQGGMTNPANCLTPVSVSPATPPGGATTGDLAIQSIFQAYTAGTTPAGDELANVWILVLKGEVGPKQFVCKSDPMSPVASSANNGVSFYLNFPTQLSGSTGPQESYGFAYAWSANSGAVGGWWKANVDSSIPVCGDVGLGSAYATLAGGVGGPKVAGNSCNHSGGEGQNVAFSDTHVEFDKTNNVGQGSDIIYATGPANPNTAYLANNFTATNPGSTVAGYDEVFWPVRTQSSGSGW